MKQILRIAKTELQVLFYSPVAWFILIIFAFQSGLFYFQYLSGYADMMEYRGAISDGTFGLFVEQRGNPTFLLKVMSYLFYFIPLLTMGVISRELSSGSIKLLYSSPVTNTQIVLGKFFSIVAYALVMVGVLFMYVVHASFIIDNFDWTFLPVSLLGIFLLICAYGAVGVYMSSLTSYQMVAALGTLVVLTLFNYVGDFWQTIEFVREITYWLGMNGRAESFITGILCSEDVLYFIVVISLFLSLTIFRLMNKREKKSKLRVCTLYMTLFAVVISVAYLSSRPSLMAYWDATRFERNTLTVGSQEVVEGLEGDIEVVTYVNIYDTPNVVWRVSPRYEVNDMQQNYGQYRRLERVTPEVTVY